LPAGGVGGKPQGASNACEGLGPGLGAPPYLVPYLRGVGTPGRPGLCSGVDWVKSGTLGLGEGLLLRWPTRAEGGGGGRRLKALSDLVSSRFRLTGGAAPMGLGAAPELELGLLLLADRLLCPKDPWPKLLLL